MNASHTSGYDQPGLNLDDISYMPSFMSPSKVISDRDPSRWKDPTPASLGLPSSNRDNIMDALRNLQNKICNLEIERTQAQDSIRALASETATYRGALHEARDKRAAADDHVSRQAQDLQTQLSSAELRCRQLDEQLESMRRLVRQAEVDRHAAAGREDQARRSRTANLERAARGQSSELMALRRDHEQLSAVQAQAESKIKALEDKLNEERHHRRLLQERAAEIASQAEANRILLRAFSPTRGKAGPAHEGKGREGKKDVHRPHGHHRTSALGPQKPAEPVTSSAGAEHYRLNLAHIPFVVGQATTASHSLGANVQRVIAMMKYHNPRLCAAAARCHRHPSSSTRLSVAGSSSSAASSHNSDGSSDPTEQEDTGERSCMGDILEQLQVEFSRLTLEHQELMRRINGVLSEQQADQLRAELAVIVAKMEAKGDQIANIVRYLECKLDTKPMPRSKKIKKRAQSEPTRHPPNASVLSNAAVTGRIKTKDRRSGVSSSIVVPVKSGSQAQRSPGRRENLCALRDVKTLQTKLKPSDLVWA